MRGVLHKARGEREHQDLGRLFGSLLAGGRRMNMRSVERPA
jgi:hypothetical protein